MQLRRLIELLARGRTFKRRMPAPFQQSSIIVSPDSQLKYLKPGRVGFDRMLLDVAVEQIRPGMNVWDIGANIGVFSVAAAALKASVVSLEADPWLVGVLERTRMLPENSGLDIKVVAAAVSNSDGIAGFMIAERGRASNALELAGGHDQMGGVREKRLVPTLRVDTICEYLPSPDFLKIDVEGAELFVLEGAEKLLKRRPGMLIEVSSARVSQITNLLRNAGYRLFDAENPSRLRREVDACSPNTLALAD